MCGAATEVGPGGLVAAAPRAEPDRERPEPLPLEPVDGITVTSLVDNAMDLLASDRGPARRASPLRTDFPAVATPIHESGEVPAIPLAEHGFSMLVEITHGPRSYQVLFDAGMTPDGLVTNMARLGLDPGDVDVVVLSHGHLDHTTGLDGFIRAVGRADLPVVIHPHFWSRRRLNLPGHEPYELPTTSRRALGDAGFEIIERPEPSFLLEGALLVTGEVDRTTDFEQGFPGHEARRDGAWRPDPLILDDQALVANLRGRGLVVLTGCGHCGAVNLLRYARRLTGIEEIHALLGGLHLTGRAFRPVIPPTIAALRALEPDVVVPSHCTGWEATHRIAGALPDAFIPNTVGTRYELTAAA